jgi:hypothetical protein
MNKINAGVVKKNHDRFPICCPGGRIRHPHQDCCLVQLKERLILNQEVASLNLAAASRSGYSSEVEFIFAKDETKVRTFLSAPKFIW